MSPKTWHNLDLRNLAHLQEELKDKVKIVPFTGTLRKIAGCDVSYSRKRSKLVAVFVVMSLPELNIIEETFHEGDITFPYIPTYLSFRELPALLSAYKKLKNTPDLIIVDGQGIAHPRGLGIASHLGVELGIPTIGCAKSRLVGDHKEPGEKKGSWVPLLFKNRIIGAVLRSRDRTKPLFVSPGHLVDVPSALKITLSLCKKYRIPEPIRYADRRSREVVNEKI